MADETREKPEERAEYIVMKLERFIREGRTLSQGVSFRQWQGLAKAEIIDMIRDVETRHARESRTLERSLMVLGTGLATIGVWGTALAIGAAPDRLVAGFLVLLSGLIVLWVVGSLGMRSPFKRFQADQRRLTTERVRSLHRKVRDLEGELKQRKKRLEAELQKTPQA